MQKKRWAIRAALFAMLTLLVFAGLSHVMERKTLTGPWAYSAKVNAYFNMPANTIDVVGFGSSHMFCSISPALMQSQAGISAYVLATQRQPVKASYFYMLEALKRQKPKVFLFETYMVNTSQNQDIEDGIIADATEPLPFSWTKLRMIHAMTEGKKSKLPYYLTLFKYHERWKDLEDGDFAYQRKAMQDPLRGYIYFSEMTPAEAIHYDEPPVIQNFDAEDLYYLEKMIELAKREGIHLLLLYAPFPMDRDSYNHCFTMANFAKEHNLPFINGYELLQEGRFDYQTDFYDDDHLNANGAGKLTLYVAQFLKEHGLLDGRRGD